MLNHFISAWYCGLRARSFHAVTLLGVALIAIAYLSASFSPRQPQTVTLDIGFSGVRFGMVLLVMFWTQELLVKEIDKKTVLFSLTYPLPRSTYLVGRYLAVLALSLVATLVLALMLLIAVFVVAEVGDYQQALPPDLGYAFWLTAFGVWLDISVVAGVATLLSSLATVQLLPFLGTLAFAIAGKSLGPVLEFMGRGADGDDALARSMGPAVDLTKWLLPDLSRLDWRVGSMYGTPIDSATMLGAVGMACAYVFICLSLAVMAFRRREFD